MGVGERVRCRGARSYPRRDRTGPDRTSGPAAGTTPGPARGAVPGTARRCRCRLALPRGSAQPGTAPLPPPGLPETPSPGAVGLTSVRRLQRRSAAPEDERIHMRLLLSGFRRALCLYTCFRCIYIQTRGLARLNLRTTELVSVRPAGPRVQRGQLASPPLPHLQGRQRLLSALFIYSEPKPDPRV